MIDAFGKYVRTGKLILHDWQKNRKFQTEAVVDHIELTPSHLVIGFQLEWRNRTAEPITIKDLRIKLHRPDDAPLMLYPLERFERLPPLHAKKAFQKTELSPFTLPPNETYREQIRFLSQEALDIAPGSYGAEIQLEDTDHTVYTQPARFDLANELKYRVERDWYGE